MNWNDFLAKLMRAPADAGGEGAGGEGAGGEGAGGEGAGGEGAGGEGAGGEGAGGEGAGGEGAAKWWEADSVGADTRQFLTLNGLTGDDPAEAAAKAADMARHAQKRLGHKPEDIMVRPKDGQSVSDWMKENPSVFGLPEDAKDYLIEKPESFDGTWDGDLANKMQSYGFENGVPPEVMKGLTGIYAEHVSGLLGGEDDKLAAATSEMRTALESDWGDQYDAKIAGARQAAQVMAERAGLDADGLKNTIQLIAQKDGDPNVMRMFSALHGMMGDDKGLGLGHGSGGFATTPQDARAEAAKMRAPDGEYAKAVASGNRAEMARLKPKLDQLDKIASQ